MTAASRPLISQLLARRAAELTQGSETERRRARLEALRPDLGRIEWDVRLAERKKDEFRAGLSKLAEMTVQHGLSFCAVYIDGLRHYDRAERSARRDALVALLRAGVPSSIVAKSGVTKAYVSQLAKAEHISLSRATKHERETWYQRLSMVDPADETSMRARQHLATAQEAGRALAASEDSFARLRALRWIWMASAVDYGYSATEIAQLARLSPQQVRSELTTEPARLRKPSVFGADAMDALHVASLHPAVDFDDGALRALHNLVAVAPATSLPRVCGLARVVLGVRHDRYEELPFDVAHRVATMICAGQLANKAFGMDMGRAELGEFASKAGYVVSQGLAELRMSATALIARECVRAALGTGEHRRDLATARVVFSLAGRVGLASSDPIVAEAADEILATGDLSPLVAFAATTRDSDDSFALRLGAALEATEFSDDPWLLAFWTRYFPNLKQGAFDEHQRAARALADDERNDQVVRASAALLASGYSSTPSDEEARYRARRAMLPLRGGTVLPQRFGGDEYARLAGSIVRDGSGDLMKASWFRAAVDLLVTPAS